MAIVEFRNVSRVYGSGEHALRALDGVNLTLEEGKFVVILGPSGAGKSTLLNLLGGLDKATEGKVFYNDKELGTMNDSKLSEFRLKNIGFVFQFFDLIPELTAEENVMFPAKLAKKKETAESDLYSALDIGDRVKHYPAELSGGQQQRAAIARALINDPDVILCDEPTGNLDKRSGEEVMNLLKKLNQEQNKTVIIVTHDSDIALQCNRVIEISDGKVISA